MTVLKWRRIITKNPTKQPRLGFLGRSSSNLASWSDSSSTSISSELELALRRPRTGEALGTSRSGGNGGMISLSRSDFGEFGVEALGCDPERFWRRARACGPAVPCRRAIDPFGERGGVAVADTNLLNSSDVGLVKFHQPCFFKLWRWNKTASNVTRSQNTAKI